MQYHSPGTFFPFSLFSETLLGGVPYSATNVIRRLGRAWEKKKVIEVCCTAVKQVKSSQATLRAALEMRYKAHMTF